MFIVFIHTAWNVCRLIGVKMIWGCSSGDDTKCGDCCFSSFFLLLFLAATQRAQISYTLEPVPYTSSHNSAFFYCWSFTPFKPSLFIGLLYRPCLLFFTPFTPLSPGSLPLHFMPSSITLHWSKWSGPSRLSALCLLNAPPSCVLRPQTVLQHPKMSLWNELRAAETIRRSRRCGKKDSRRLFTCDCASMRLHLSFCFEYSRSTRRVLFTGEAVERNLSRCNADVPLSSF